MTIKTCKDKILIVDDQPENIWPLTQHLQSGFDVLCVTSGKEALEIVFSENRPDLILLDIMMPGMDGYQVCEKLKADNSTRQIPVIFLTGKTADPEQVKGLEAGAQDYITKPFSLPVVMARVKSVLNLKKEMDRRLLLKTQLEALNQQLEHQVRQRQRELEAAREALTQYEDKWSSLFNKNGVDEKALKRVLVVDDNPENIHILVNNLQSRYEVICTTSGKEALEIAFSDDRPDIILLDIMMPDMDGFEVCSRLKANAETWSIPVIFITALGQEVDETRGLNLGAVDFITKPFSIPVAKARIEAQLRLKEEMDHRITLARKLEALNKNLEARIQKKAAALEQAHEDLKTSEYKYRSIYENAIEGIFQATPEGRFLSVNPALARMHGYDSPEDLIAHVTDIGRQHYVNPEERTRFQECLEEHGSVRGFETEEYRKDGSRIWVSINAHSVRGSDGGIRYYEGTVEDVSEHRRLAKALRDSEARYRHITETLTDYIYTVRVENGKSVETRHGAGCLTVTGYTEEEFAADPHLWFRMVAEEDRTAVVDSAGRVMAGEKASAIEQRLVRKDGVERWVRNTPVVRRDTQGNLVSYDGLIQDITERKRAEEEIRRLNQELEQRVKDRTARIEAANRELDAFAYSVSHDLRTPLRHIDGFLELLQKKAVAVLDEQSRHYMDTISDAAKKMGLLIDDLLSFSRMGRHAMSFQPVDLGPLVQEVIREQEPDTQGRDIHWHVGDLPIVSGDRAMLKIVLVNLLSNAIKFTRTRPNAEIEVECLAGQEAETFIAVRDNGVGFDMTYVDKLFGVFQHLHRADEFEGTGIGLANVRRIINRHGGRTWAEGKVDQGATFYFSLSQTQQGGGYANH